MIYILYENYMKIKAKSNEKYMFLIEKKTIFDWKNVFFVEKTRFHWRNQLFAKKVSQKEINAYTRRTKMLFKKLLLFLPGSHLCMLVHACAWLCMIVHDYTRLRMIMHQKRRKKSKTRKKWERRQKRGKHKKTK